MDSLLYALLWIAAFVGRSVALLPLVALCAAHALVAAFIDRLRGTPVDPGYDI